MKNDIGNYARHAQYWDWSGHDRAAEHKYWLDYAGQYGKNVLIPMCAWGETGAYMAEHGLNVTAFDIAAIQKFLSKFDKSSLNRRMIPKDV